MTEPKSGDAHGTPEGHTPEQPFSKELGKKGTPGAGLTPAAPHAADADEVAHHDPVTHMDAHASLSDDDHGHAEPRLGPIDWRAWLYAVVGFAAGLLVVAVFWLKAG